MTEAVEPYHNEEDLMEGQGEPSIKRLEVDSRDTRAEGMAFAARIGKNLCILLQVNH